MRPSFTSIHLDFARGLSRRSACRRLQVGCVITTVDYRRVLAFGYNGNARGLEDDCDSDTVGACGCVHAEEAAAISCVSTERKVVFSTHLPCKMCAKRLLNLGGVERVVYAETYRSSDSVQLFQLAKIDVVHVNSRPT